MRASPATTLGRSQRRTIRLSDSGQAATGELRLRVARHGGLSVAEQQFHQGGLSVMRSQHLDESGQVCYAVINSGGGYLDDDLYVLDLDVGANASLLLTSQSATKVYRTPTAPACQMTRARLEAGAVLESLPDQIIVYRDGMYRQDCVVEMDPAATYLAGEVITAGWSPDGSDFAYQSLELRTAVTITESAGPRLALVDNLILRPQAAEMPATGLMDGHTHLGSFLVVDRRVDADLVDEAFEICQGYEPAVHAGVTLAGGPSLVMRALGGSTGDLTALILDLDAMVRRHWLGQNRANLRKH